MRLTIMTLSIALMATALATAVVTKGSAFADATPSLHIQVDPADWNFDTDWDLTKLHCWQVEWDFTDITAVSVKAAIDGVVYVDVSNMDWTGSAYDGASPGAGGTNGVKSIVLNNYSNRSALVGNPWTTPRVASTRKYEDNYTVREGAPRACSLIGFPTSYDAAFPP